LGATLLAGVGRTLIAKAELPAMGDSHAE